MSSSRIILFNVDNMVIVILLGLLVASVIWRRLFRWSTGVSPDGIDATVVDGDPGLVEIPALRPGGKEKRVLVVTCGIRRLVNPYTWLTQGLSAAGITVLSTSVDELCMEPVQGMNFHRVILILDRHPRDREASIIKGLSTLQSNGLIVLSTIRINILRELAERGFFSSLSERHKLLDLIFLSKQVERTGGFPGSDFQGVFKIGTRSKLANAELLVLSQILAWTN